MKTDEVAPGVFRFKAFTPRQARDFLFTIGEYVLQDGHPNSMNKYGKILGGKARWWLAEMQADYISPVAEAHFADLKPLKKYPYAFTVEYDVKKQRSLAAHFDSSSVTLNLCLAGDFEGGDVVFYGDGVGGSERRRHVVQNKVGYGIVHRGAHVHRATKLTKGTRTNLIFWCAEKKR